MTTNQKIRFINNAVKEIANLKILSRELRRQLDQHKEDESPHEPIPSMRAVLANITTKIMKLEHQVKTMLPDDIE